MYRPIEHNNTNRIDAGIKLHIPHTYRNDTLAGFRFQGASTVLRKTFSNGIHLLVDDKHLYRRLLNLGMHTHGNLDEEIITIGETLCFIFFCTFVIPAEAHLRNYDLTAA